jgi:hypothetical protein
VECCPGIREGTGGGEETPSEPESSGGCEEENEDEEEGEVPPRSHSLPLEILPLLSDFFD